MLLYWILLPIVWPLLHILWRIEVVGKENIPRGRAHVIASNHLSDLDPVYILEAVFSWKRYTILAKNGTPILIFPEGTRSKTGELLTLKSGAFLIAGNADADMVPCRIIYDTPDKRMHMFCRIRICFGTPIPAEEMKVEDPRRSVPKLRALRTRLKTELERLYEENHF